eukprot:20693-Heterococcus_DN1.PRE.1
MHYTVTVGTCTSIGQGMHIQVQKLPRKHIPVVLKVLKLLQLTEIDNTASDTPTLQVPSLEAEAKKD